MNLLDILDMTHVSEICRRDAIFTSESLSLASALNGMDLNHQGATVVLDAEGTLAGIFTERDVLLRLSGLPKGWRERSIGEFMTRDPVVIRESKSIAEALTMMQEGNFRHLPVVDDHDQPRGIISIRNILSHVVEYFPEEFINLPPRPSLEAKSDWGG